jgi:pSer/pThr/pTyr-binding forkhead associated (FHA) protein
VSIGCDPSNDVVLADDTISSRHATVWPRAATWLEDLRSVNGTTVNGGRAPEPMQ